MKNLFVRTLTFFNTIESKIAFYPTIMALGGFALTIGMTFVESTGISNILLKRFPNLILEDGDTVLTILSACVGGIISMMVFSFSMVMLLLSQASSNFSPRLLPGLISDKRHQVILGTYLASIIYIIFTLFAIEPEDKQYNLPGISILVGIGLTIACLGAFISFIHNISQSIQINNILDKIYNKSKKRLVAIVAAEKELSSETLKFPETNTWYHYSVEKSGYFQNISLSKLSEYCEKINTKIYIAKPKGFFVLQNANFYYSEKRLTEDEQLQILSYINFTRGELIEDNYVLAFKQIIEIAVKAMSPGINDPGTAINAIDYLTELFSYRMQKKDQGVYVEKGKEAHVKIAVVHFQELLYNSMASLRTYCKHDPIIVQKLLYMLLYLKERNCADNTYKMAINNEIKALLVDAKGVFENNWDIAVLENLEQSV